MTDVPAAVTLFKKGCACSQAILAVCGARFGRERDVAMRGGLRPAGAA